MIFWQQTGRKTKQAQYHYVDTKFPKRVPESLKRALRGTANHRIYPGVEPDHPDAKYLEQLIISTISQ